MKLLKALLNGYKAGLQTYLMAKAVPGIEVEYDNRVSDGRKRMVINARKSEINFSELAIYVARLTNLNVPVLVRSLGYTKMLKAGTTFEFKGQTNIGKLSVDHRL